MFIKDLFKTALSSITSNKVQAFLSMLGVIIGISSIVTIISISQGVKKNVELQLQDFGTNVVEVNLYGLEDKGFELTADKVYGITNSKFINYASIEIRNYINDLSYQDVDTSATNYGVDAFYQEQRDLKLAKGRFINDADVIAKRQVIVLGATTATELFKNENPLGRNVTIPVYNFETGSATFYDFIVVGVLSEKESVSFEDPNKSSYIAHTTLTSLFDRQLDNFRYVASSADDVQKSIADAKIYIQGLIYPYIVQEYNSIFDANNSGGFYPGGGGFYPGGGGLIYEEDFDGEVVEASPRFGLIPGGSYTPGAYNPVENYYYIYDSGEFVNQSLELINMITLLIAAIAAISLLVGGIGIANVMFMSVLERTKEIGLRKAVGARNKDIVVQFLIESVIVTCVGGTIGLVLGVIISLVISLVVEEISTAFTPSVMIGTFLVSVLTGVLAGYFPAKKAAKLNPIDALRYE